MMEEPTLQERGIPELPAIVPRMLSASITDRAAFFIERAYSAVMQEKMFADRALERIFREERLVSGVLRSAVAVALYDVLRNARLLESVADGDFSEMLAAWCVLRGLPEPLLSVETSSPENLAARLREAAQIRAVRLSVPDWLDTLGEKELGSKWKIVADALLNPPQTVVRTALSRISRPNLMTALGDLGFAPKPLVWNECGIIVNSTDGLFATEEFRKGFYEMQDAASQMVGLFCNIRPGMRVIDGCAGAGGKTLHLADIMENRGRIVALDVREQALVDLRGRAARAHADIIEARHITSTKTVKRLAESGQCVLLDMPCSGSGVLRRNPDAKWRLTADDMAEFRRKQGDILERYSRMAAPDGWLVYAVCSIFPSEGEHQIAAFLERNSTQWHLEAERRYCPADDGSDGFYMARLKRLR